MFGDLDITQLLVVTSSISFLANHFVIAELFCGEFLQYSHKFEYIQTAIVFENIPEGFDNCLIRITDKIGNVFTKLIKIQ